MRQHRRALFRAVIAGGCAGAGLAAGVLAARRRAAALEAPLPPGRLALVAQNSLWLVDATSSQRRLASGAGGWIQDPQWSPDGTQLAYTQFQQPLPVPGVRGIPWPVADLFVARPLDPRDTPSLVLRHEQPDEAFISTAWTADGRALYVVRRRTAAPGSQDVSTDLLRVDVAARSVDVVDVGPAPVEVTVGADNTLAAVVNPPAPASSAAPSALVVLGPDGARRTVVTTTDSTDFLILPRFAPGGRRIVFVSTGNGPAAAAAPSDEGLSVAARWFGRLPFGRIPAAQAHGLPGWPWVVDLDSGELRRVPTPGADDLDGLAWLADGRRLLTLDVDGLAIVDAADGTVLRVPSLNGSAFAWYEG